MTTPDFIDVPVQLDEATARRLDALVLRLSKDHPVPSSEVLRAVLLNALERVQKDPEAFAELLRAKI